MTETLPPNYNPAGLAPVIYVYDQNLRLQYTYEHPNISDNPTQDFPLLEWSISSGINSNAGVASIVIEDHTDALTDDRGALVIRPGWHLQILLGKSADNLEAWFFGIVNEPTLMREGYRQQTVLVSAYGYAHTLSTRFVSVKHLQRRDDTGTLDNTDMSACVSEIVKSLFEESNLLLPPADPNLSLDGIDDIDIKIASIDKNNQSQGIVISELANVVNAAYGVDPSLRFFFHTVEKHSGFIITNGDATNIALDKLLITANSPARVKETSVRKAVTSLIGTNLTLKLDLLKDVGGAGERSFNQGFPNHLAFTIPNSAIAELEMMWKRTGGYTSLTGNGIEYEVWETSGTTHGTYYNSNTREYEFDFGSGNNPERVAFGTISYDTLRDMELNQRTWVSVRLGLPKLDSSVRVRIMLLRDVGRNSNLTMLYNASLPRQIFPINNGSGSSAEDGTPRLRIFGEPQQTLLKAQNLAIQRQQTAKEQVQYLADEPTSETATSIFEGLLDSAGQTRKIYSMTALVPHARPPLGERCSIKDDFNDLDTNALLIGYDVASDVRRQLVAKDMNLELETIS